MQATKNSKPVTAILIASGATPNNPKDNVNTAKTFNMKWPANILAKRRTESVIGLMQ